tara:strand:- start:257 stop:748 length:492 start_codon:yes stop_codon:yes gene_type:complete
MKKFLFLLIALLLLGAVPNRPLIISIVKLESKPIKEIVFEIRPIDEMELVNALITIESQGNDSAIGDTHLGEPSVGVLQLRPIMVREVNRILKLKRSEIRFKRKDRFSREKSIEMFLIWKEFHHKDSNFETIARNWNGGPNGYKRSSTLHYWKKVENELKLSI